MNTVDTQNLLVSVIIFGVVLGAFGMIATYGWMMILDKPVNAGFGDIVKFTSGSLFTLAGVVINNWMAKSVQK